MMYTKTKIEYGKGDRILVIDQKRGGEIVLGTVTFRSVESGKTVYDYTDDYENPRWCYASEILCGVQRAPEERGESG